MRRSARTHPGPLGWPGRALVVGLAAAIMAGCASLRSPQHDRTAPVPESAARPVTMPEASAPPPAAPAVIPEKLLQPGATLALADIVELALQNNPLTRTSYLRARAAAAALGAERSAHYPRVDASVAAVRGSSGAVGAGGGAAITTYGPSVALSMLVLDMGGRAADIEGARLELLVADWTHNATVQGVVLGVQLGYVAYLDARSQLAAARTSVETAQAALDAATVRHEAGVATIAEVLLARTALSQAQLAVDTLVGRVMALRGSLATAMGLPATTPYDVGELPAELPWELADGAVEPLIEQARARRPDLAAALVGAERAATRIRSARADGLPSLSATASAGRTWYDPDAFGAQGDSWTARLLLNVPLFTGFEVKHNVEKAREDAAAARAQAEVLEQQVILGVWTSYYGVKTAGQLVRTSRDLLASAKQSERVAFGRYTEGVGTIIDLLAAQSALAEARSQEIRARAQWFAALARLAHDTGTVSPALQAMIAVTQGSTQP
jgi:outer membrane protein TolC